MQKRQRPDDRLGFARNLLLASWLVMIFVLGWMALDATLRPSVHERSSCALARALSLSQLSIVPTARPLRHPETLHPGVDLRFSPLLTPVEAEPAGLLITKTGLSTKGLRR
jgi:hypothetical protein